MVVKSNFLSVKKPLGLHVMGSPNNVKVLNDCPIGSGKLIKNFYFKAERHDEHKQQPYLYWWDQGLREAIGYRRSFIDEQYNH
jgi:hypothetical protein